MADHMHISLVCQAIDMSARRCPVEEGVTIFHSDRGGTSTRPRGSSVASSLMVFARQWGVRGCAGTPLGLQSFNATLKNERAHRMVYPTKDKAIKDIASWIELRYSRTRLHPTLGYRTPDGVESDFLDLTNAA